MRLHSFGRRDFNYRFQLDSTESLSPLGLSVCDFSSRERKEASQAAHRQQRPKGRKEGKRKLCILLRPSFRSCMTSFLLHSIGQNKS